MSPRLPSALVGLTMVAFVLVKTGRDAVVVGRDGGAALLPLAFGVGGLAALGAAALHVLAMRAFGVRRVRVAVYLGAAAIALAAPLWAAGSPSAAVHVAFFGLTPVVFAALFADAWLLVGDAVEGQPEEAQRRAYVGAATASTAGGIGGALSAMALASQLAAPWLVAVGGALLLGGAALSLGARRRSTREPAPPPSGEEPGAATVVMRLLRRPFVGLLAALASLAAVAGVLVDVQLYRAASAHRVADASFFAWVYLAVSVAALAFQLTGARLLERRVGLVGVLAALPLGLGGLAALALFSSTMGARFALRATEGGLKAAVHRAAWERAFQPVAAPLRPYVKTLVDGAAARLAESGAGFALAMASVSLPRLTAITLAVVGLWLGATWLLRRFTVTVRQGDGAVEQRLHEACPVASILGRDAPP